MKLNLVLMYIFMSFSVGSEDFLLEDTGTERELQELKYLLLNENAELKKDIKTLRDSLDLEIKLRVALEKKVGDSRMELKPDTKEDSQAKIYLFSKVKKLEEGYRAISFKLDEIIRNSGNDGMDEIKKSLQNLMKEMDILEQEQKNSSSKVGTIENRSKSNSGAIVRLETKTNQCDQGLATLRKSVKDIEDDVEKACSKNCQSTSPKPSKPVSTPNGNSGKSTVGSEGREFVLAFMRNYKPNLPIKLRIGARSSGTVTVKAPGVSYSKTFAVNKDFIEISLPTNLMHSGTGIASNGVSVTSTTDVTVIAEAHGQGEYITNDNALVLPTNMLSTEYYAASFTQLIQADQFSQLIVVGLHSATTVQVIIRTGPIIYGGRAYRAGDIMAVTIGILQTFQIQHTVDLTGTLITSTKPVAVFSGSTCTFVPDNIKSCDELYEQMIPTKSLSKSYIVPPVLPRAGYVARIIVTQDGTNVQTSAGSKNGLNRGQSLTATMGSKSPLSITANKPVSVFQYGPGQDYDKKNSGDPYMALVPALNQFQSSYNFACTPGFTCNIAITIAATYKTGLILDGKAFTNYAEVAVPSPHTMYTTVFKTVYGVSHTLRHTSSDVTFGLMVYGLKRVASFGYPGGLKTVNPAA